MFWAFMLWKMSLICTSILPKNVTAIMQSRQRNIKKNGMGKEGGNEH